MSSYKAVSSSRDQDKDKDCEGKKAKDQCKQGHRKEKQRLQRDVIKLGPKRHAYAIAQDVFSAEHCHIALWVIRTTGW